jgi:D-sedoheptulose 7-phosphate isomerase
MTYSIQQHLKRSSETFNRMIDMSSELEDIAQIMLTKLRNNGAVYWFGNGGSASDAEHLAAELSGRFAIDREPINSFSLTCNSSVVTAIANDYGFEEIFARQVKAHVKSADVVIGITTSGKSANVLNGLKAAKTIGATTVLFTGESLNNIGGTDFVLQAPSKVTAHIQEVHIAIGQALCGFIESEIVKSADAF